MIPDFQKVADFFKIIFVFGICGLILATYFLFLLLSNMFIIPYYYIFIPFIKQMLKIILYLIIIEMIAVRDLEIWKL